LQPTIPECAQHVWEWWWELNARRAPGFDSLSPLSYSEIHSWILLTKRFVAPEDIRWLMQMDDAWLRQISTERKDKSEREKDEADRKRQTGR